LPPLIFCEYKDANHFAGSRTLKNKVADFGDMCSSNRPIRTAARGYSILGRWSLIERPKRFSSDKISCGAPSASILACSPPPIDAPRPSSPNISTSRCSGSRRYFGPKKVTPAWLSTSEFRCNVLCKCVVAVLCAPMCSETVVFWGKSLIQQIRTHVAYIEERNIRSFGSIIANCDAHAIG